MHAHGIRQEPLVRAWAQRRLKTRALQTDRALQLLRRSYLAPLLYALSAEDAPSKQSYALMLFPLKALAQDQLKACVQLLATAGKCADAAEAAKPPLLPAASIARLRRMASIVCNTYDGDCACPRYGHCGWCLHALNACAIHFAFRCGF